MILIFFLIQFLRQLLFECFLGKWFWIGRKLKGKNIQTSRILIFILVKYFLFSSSIRIFVFYFFSILCYLSILPLCDAILFFSLFFQFTVCHSIQNIFFIFSDFSSRVKAYGNRWGMFFYKKLRNILAWKFFIFIYKLIIDIFISQTT